MIGKSLLFLFLTSIITNNSHSQDIFKNEQQHQAAFRLVLSEELITIYDRILEPSLKAEWEQKYWKIFDPTPGTDQNEIYDQFIQRFAVAKKYYSNIIAPLYLDDRGKYYLKYGEPDDRIISSGVGKPYNDNETWSYYQYNLYIDFVDQIGFGYREVVNLLDAVTSGPSNIKTVIAANLYLERQPLHQKYLSFRSVIDGSAGLAADSRFYQITRDLITEKKLALDAAPQANFDFSYEQEQLEAQMSSAIFRGEYNLSRVEFYYSFPLRNLKFEPGTQFPLESIMEKKLMLFDQNFDKIFQRDENIKLIARNQSEIKKRIYINQHSEQLPAGLYNVVLQLESRQSKRLAILRAQLNVKNFSSDSLTISDIQFSPQIKEGITNQRNLKPNNLLVVPYVGNTIRKTTPIYIYFEIYNLTINQDGKSRFQISYEVRSVADESSSVLAAALQIISHLVGKKSEQRIGSAFETEGNDEFQQIYLMIDFSKFPTGHCSLTISITDLENGARVLGKKSIVLQ